MGALSATHREAPDLIRGRSGRSNKKGDEAMVSHARFEFRREDQFNPAVDTEAARDFHDQPPQKRSTQISAFLFRVRPEILLHEDDCRGSRLRQQYDG